MDIDETSWGILLVAICLNAARDSIMGSDEDSGTNSQILFVAVGWVLMFCFLFMFHRLQRMVYRLLQLGGCQPFQRGSEQEGEFKDMQHVLLRLHQSKPSQCALSAEQVQKEVEDWKKTNSKAAKTAVKNAVRRSLATEEGTRSAVTHLHQRPPSDTADDEDAMSDVLQRARNVGLQSRSQLSFGLEGKSQVADLEGEGAVVFPDRGTIALAFKEDVATLKLYGRAQDALILFNSCYLAMFCVHFGSQMLASGGGGVIAVNVIKALLALTPPLVNMWFCAPMVVLRSSFISFVVSLRPETLGQVIEDEAESQNLRKVVNEKLTESMATIFKLSATLALQEKRASGLGTNSSLHQGLGAAEQEMYGKKVIRRIFDDIDINNDGSLDRHEFLAALEQLGVYLSRKVFDRLMRLIDVDGSGTVDYDEFIALLYNDDNTLLEVVRAKCMRRYGKGHDTARDAARAVLQNLQEFFRALDTEGTGELSTEVFGNALIQGFDIELSPHLLKQLVAVFDVDNSGSIDFDEFRTVMMSDESWDLIAHESPGMPRRTSPVIALTSVTHVDAMDESCGSTDPALDRVIVDL
jgi:Ca2+-binding EF-hand superfamily protein